MEGVSKRGISFLLLFLLLATPLSSLAQENDNSSIEYVTFTEINPYDGINWKDGVQVNWTSYGPGVSWADADNDGNLDLFISASYDHLGYECMNSDTECRENPIQSYGTTAFFWNNGSGSFEDRSADVNLRFENSSATSGVWGDYDGDGDLDLYISEFGETNIQILNLGAPNRLMENQFSDTGVLKFIDVTEYAGVGNSGHSSNAQWVDFDNDGDLDLYSLNVGNIDVYESTTSEESNILYQNNGNKTFTDVTRQTGLWGGVVQSETPGIPEQGPLNRFDQIGPETPSSQGVSCTPQECVVGSGLSWAALWFDYDYDGWMDVYIASAFGMSPLYRNVNGTHFELLTEEKGLDKLGTGMGVDAGDYDQDGDLDLCVSNFGSNYLWVRDSNGTYIEEGKAAGIISNPLVNWVCEFFDYDLDGDLDLFFTIGSVNPYFTLNKNSLFVNNGDGTFTDIIDEDHGMYYNEEKSQGGAIADYDNDGDLDIVIGNSNGPVRLFRNNAVEETGRHWLMIKLVGDGQNTAGIGSKVWVEVNQNTTYHTQVYACSGSFGCHDQRLHFGLDGETSVESITITWPNGEIQQIENVAADQVLEIYQKPIYDGDVTSLPWLIVLLSLVLLLMVVLYRKN